MEGESKQESNRSLLIILVLVVALGAVWLLFEWDHSRFLAATTTIETVDVKEVRLVLAKSDVWTSRVPHVVATNDELLDTDKFGTNVKELEKIFTPGSHRLEIHGQKGGSYHREIAAVLDP